MFMLGYYFKNKSLPKSALILAPISFLVLFPAILGTICGIIIDKHDSNEKQS